MFDQSANKRVLLLTYAFPPLQASESFLSVKAFARINSYNIDILTIDSTNIGYALDYSLESYTSEHFGNIYRAQPPKWITKKAFKFLRYVPGFPDRFRFFNNQMFKKALEIKAEDYDLIVSWSTWHSIHIVAEKLKTKFPSIRWLAHLSDPWADNPFLTKIIGYKASQYLLERNILSKADAINFTTNRSRMLVMQKYPSSWINKTYVTPHSYDDRLYSPSHKKNNNNKLIINYLGNFYGPRNPTTFLNALRLINKEDDNFLSGVTFRFIGKWIDNENWKLVLHQLPADLIEIVKPIPYIDSLKEMSNSDLLLILDAPFTSSVFFPSKLVDYIGAKKPIFTITPPGSCLDILEKVGGIHAYPENESTIIAGIKEAIQQLKKGTLISPDPNLSSRYSNLYVSREFEIIFHQTINYK